MTRNFDTGQRNEASLEGNILLGSPKDRRSYFEDCLPRIFFGIQECFFYRDRVCHYVALAGLQLLKIPLPLPLALRTTPIPPRTVFLNEAFGVLRLSQLIGCRVGAAPPGIFRPNGSIFTSHPERTSTRQGNRSALPCLFPCYFERQPACVPGSASCRGLAEPPQRLRAGPSAQAQRTLSRPPER